MFGLAGIFPASQLLKVCLLFLNPDFFFSSTVFVSLLSFMSPMNLVSVPLPLTCASKSEVLEWIEARCTIVYLKDSQEHTCH